MTVRKPLLIVLPLALLHLQCKTPNSGSQTLASETAEPPQEEEFASQMTLWVGFRAPTVGVQDFAAKAFQERKTDMWMAVAPAKQLANGVFARVLPEVVSLGDVQIDNSFDGDFYKFADAGKSSRYEVVPANQADPTKVSGLSRIRAYSMIDADWNNWQTGTTTVRVRAVKRADSSDVLKALLAHAKAQVAAVNGLKGYVVLADRGFVVEVMNWAKTPAKGKDGAQLAALTAGAPVEYPVKNK